MNKKIKLLTASAVNIMCFSVSANVIELNSLKEIRPLIDKDTIVVFDIDNTLIHTAQSLGSAEWYYHMYCQYLKNGFSKAKATSKAVDDWRDVNNFTTVLSVETKTSQFVSTLQKNNIHVVGLTARPNDVYTMTKKQLLSQNIDFSKHTISADADTRLSSGARYTKGIIFSDTFNKGKVLLNFFEHFNIKPKKVVFVDDVEKNVHNVNDLLTSKNIPVTSVRYSALDTTVKSFDSKITDLQMEIFRNKKQLISNTTATNILKNKCHLNKQELNTTHPTC